LSHYQITAADRRPLPKSYSTEPRHLGYSDDEKARPFAHYFQADVRPIQDHVRNELLAGQSPTEYGYELDEVVTRLSAPGYHRMETGWTRTKRGTLVIACLTDMPGVTAGMWDWWFGWHSTDTARYKLWHPDAHQFATVGEDRSADRSLTDRQRYLDNVSYVDEYIGASLNRLAIRFVDPTRLGFPDRTGRTHICARVGASDLPVALGWLVHQVRPTEHGSEMRSRFFIGQAQVLDVPPHAVSKPAAARVLTSRAARLALGPVVSTLGRRIASDRLGHDLLHHCAGEMNHLAGFLPDLYAEFRGTP
jgi:DAPG hydrolase PhiG domain